MFLRNFLIHAGLLTLEATLRFVVTILKMKTPLPKSTCHASTQTENEGVPDAVNDQRNVNEEWCEWADVVDQRTAELLTPDTIQTRGADEQTQELHEDSEEMIRGWDHLHALHQRDYTYIIGVKSRQRSEASTNPDPGDHGWSITPRSRDNVTFPYLCMVGSQVGRGERDSIVMESAVAMHEWDRETVWLSS